MIKHTNPCGLAVHPDQAEAYRRAFDGDPVSAYGGILGFRRRRPRRCGGCSSRSSSRRGTRTRRWRPCRRSATCASCACRNLRLPRRRSRCRWCGCRAGCCCRRRTRGGGRRVVAVVTPGAERDGSGPGLRVPSTSSRTPSCWRRSGRAGARAPRLPRRSRWAVLALPARGLGAEDGRWRLSATCASCGRAGVRIPPLAKGSIGGRSRCRASGGSELAHLAARSRWRTTGDAALGAVGRAARAVGSWRRGSRTGWTRLARKSARGHGAPRRAASGRVGMGAGQPFWNNGQRTKPPGGAGEFAGETRAGGHRREGGWHRHHLDASRLPGQDLRTGLDLAAEDPG